MPPRHSQKIAAASSTSQPARSVTPKAVPAATPVTKPVAKRRRVATPEEDDVEDDADTDDIDRDSGDRETTESEAPAPKRKQKRTRGTTSGSAGQEAPSQWKKVRGKRGILQKITDTPLDVLFEIFSYLGPLDLLQISRTTKDLRQLLMTKSSAYIWERARLAIEGLPPKPDDLNDPQYINLLFDKHCHECSNGIAQNVQWEARLRLCKSCLQSNRIMTANLSDLSQLSTHYPSLAEITPQYTLVASSGHYSSKCTTYYHLPTYRRLAAESVQAPDFRIWLDQKREEYMDLTNEFSCRPFERWLTTKKTDRTEELAALRGQRLSSIYERLKADGWTEELKDPDVQDIVCSHKLVNQAKALTERIWDNIKPTLTLLMTDIREELLVKKIRTAVPRRRHLVIELCRPILSDMPEIPIIPNALVIPDLQPFPDIIENTPHDQDLTDDDFAEALASLPDICTLWRQQQEDGLKSKLSALGLDVNLSLAANAFTCSSNHSGPDVLHYPYFASHFCFSTSWDHTQITVASENIRTNCEEIIRSCDLDPATATAQDMDAMDPFFQCEACTAKLWQPPNSKVLYLMCWRVAEKHPHLGKLQRVTDPEFITRAKIEELSLLRAAIASKWFRSGCFVCNHCGVPNSSSNREDLRVHLDTAHGVTGPIENHYRHSAKFSADSTGIRVSVPVQVPAPADASSTLVEDCGPPMTENSDTASTGDAVGEGEGGHLAPRRVSSAPLDAGAEERDISVSGDIVLSASADSG